MSIVPGVETPGYHQSSSGHKTSLRITSQGGLP